MKEKFPGHFKLSDKEIQKVWDKGIFVLDANILLNLYRYSDDTRKQFLKILRMLKGRIWVPHQAAKEYLKNRLGVIGQQEKAYETTIKDIKSIEDNLKSKRQHPFLSEKSLAGLCRSFEAVIKELERSKKSHTNLIADDSILDSIEKLVKSCIGEPYDDKRLEEIRKEGEKRYAASIPPGYKDASKGSDGDPNRKFGDLIIWKQILDKAKSEKTDVILILDDNKEDWWRKFQGNTIGPQPDLIAEFIEITGQNFQMYLADRFLSYAGGYLKEQVSAPAIEELRKLREMEEVRYRRHRDIIRRKESYERIESLRHQVPELEAELDMVKQHKRFFQDEMRHLHENHPDRANAEHGRIHQEMAHLESKEEKLMEHLERLHSEISYHEGRSNRRREPTSR